MGTLRDGKFVSPSWAAGLMAGKACTWAPWFWTRNKSWDRPPDDGTSSLDTWRAAHSRLVIELATELRARGLTILQEDQGSFRIKGPTGLVISGRPDIIAINGDDIYVYDAKTGQPRDSDRQQVLIYVYCLGLTTFKGKTIHGRIRYQTGEESQLEPDRVTSEFRDHFKFFMRLMDSDNEPPRVPSSWECRFCNIGHGDCPERIDYDPDAMEPVEVIDLY